MKKSKVIRKLVKLLKTFENSEMNEPEAEKVLRLLEREGMLPPEVSYKEGYSNCEWETE
jgi:hypothetical protein